MNSYQRRLVGRKPSLLALGLATLLAVVSVMGYAATVSAQGSSSSGCSVNSMGAIASNDRDTEVAEWKTNCSSQNRSGAYARFYSFRVNQTSDVRIDLRSTDDPVIDAYLYLILGSSKTGTVLEQDDNDGDGRNSRITRRLPAGTYTIEATTRSSSKTGGFTLSVEVNKPTAKVTASSAFVNQSVILWASTPASMGSVYRYQWQRWDGSSWEDEGSRSSSSIRSVQNSTPGTETYRVVVSYQAGGSGTSVPVSVEWVKVAQATYSPDAPDIGDSVTLKVDNDGAPSGTTYQWQKKSGTAWKNVGSASSSKTKTESQSSRGTVQYRVQAKYKVGSATVTDTSDTLKVTWGEWRIVYDLSRGLDIALFGSSAAGGFYGQEITQGNPTVTSSQTKFLDCVNEDRTGSTRFTSFYGVLKSYTSVVANTVDDCEGRSSKPTTMFRDFKEGVNTELGKLKTSVAEYGDYLATARGQTLAAGLATEALLKILGNTVATDVETPSGTGMDCVPNSEPSTLLKKLGAVNCLVFRTPHSFWAGISDDDTRTLRGTDWLDTGTWDCDAVADGALPSCRKHDVAFGSLQKFTGTDSVNELDRTWNPRNKALADAKFWVDIMEHGCDSNDIEALTCGVGNVAQTATAFIYHTGVSKWNHKGWPVTTQDLDDARAHRSYPSTSGSTTGGVSGHSFVDCEDEVPTVEDVTVTRDRNDEDFSVEWAHADGCVDEIVIGRIEAWLAIEFDNGEVGYDTADNLKGTATSATFDLSPWRDLEPVGGLFEVYLHPKNRVYGGEYYIHEFTIDEVE